ncbi:tetratricopeptide repeat protein [Candidatus Uabimicrobium sp. HlEnr_7]|uniref:protein kinase domain-containing protein n=1 Tax=Candidatus Uabimicrobium helgolandensis TaxID=3095367 RepID=UPI003555DB19
MKNFGRYQLLQEIGRGGMGIVYRAYDTKFKTVVALKIMIRDEKEHIDRFFRETTAVAKLNHPNIVRFYECGGSPKPYFTMEYIEGVTLSSLIHKKNIPPTKLVDIMIAVCEAMQYGHSNRIMHRDIKPSNIMISKSGEVKIMDFGLAKIADESKQFSKSGQIIGTAYYMAPEQVEGKADYKSDIYSLGASMYEALTYRTVYQGALEINILVQITTSYPIPPRQLNPDISPYLEAICLKCLQRNPFKRYHNFKQLTRELKNFKAQKPILAKKYTSWDVLGNFIRKHKVICACLAFIFLTLFTSLIITLNALNYAEKATQKAQREKDRTKVALNKVMKVLSYSIKEHAVLQEDAKFATLCAEIFSDVETYGENKDWSFLKGYITSISGATKKSLEYYDRQIQRNPSDIEAYNNRGLLYSENKEYQKALEDFNRALTINSNYSDCYNNRGLLFLEQGKYSKALADFNKALQLNNRDYNAYNNRGLLYREQNLYSKALADFDKALEIAPDNFEIYNNVGLLYRYLEQYDEAINSYNKALQINPKFVEAYNNRGNLYKDKKLYEKALTDYNNVLKINPNYYKTYNSRGVIYKSLKKYEQALSDYSKALEINPQFAEGYYNRAILYHQKKEIKKSINDLDTAIKLKPDFYSAYINRGIVYRNLRKYNIAIHSFTKASTIKPYTQRAYAELYLCHKKLNNKKEAKYFRDKVAQLKKEK